MAKTALPKIAVDAMGADLGPQEVVKGVRMALKTLAHRFEKIILVGPEEILHPLALNHGLLKKEGLVEIFHAPQVIEMGEKPVHTLKQKKDASMFRAIDLVKEGRADAVLSCGNTGSLMAGGTLKLKTLKGVERPALATVIPAKDHRFILIDVGANPGSSATHLFHNAVLGSHYARATLGQVKPRVGLLTIGTEEGKGNELINEAHAYLKEFKSGSFHYVGLIEGFHVFNDHVDVVVCDGFVGNILLKTCESLFNNLKGYLKEELQKTCVRKVGTFFVQGVFRNMKKQFSPERYGGAPLLGLNGWVFKAHGSSNAMAIMSALQVCVRCLEGQNLQTVMEDIESTNEIIRLKQALEGGGLA